MQPIGEKKDSIFEDGADAQNLCRDGYQLLVFRVELDNSMSLEHVPFLQEQNLECAENNEKIILIRKSDLFLDCGQ